MDKQIATKIAHIKNLKRKGIMEEGAPFNPDDMADFNRYVNKLMNKTTDAFLKQKYNDFMKNVKFGGTALSDY